VHGPGNNLHQVVKPDRLPLPINIHPYGQRLLRRGHKLHGVHGRGLPDRQRVDRYAGGPTRWQQLQLLNLLQQPHACVLTAGRVCAQLGRGLRAQQRLRQQRRYLRVRGGHAKRWHEPHRRTGVLQLRGGRRYVELRHEAMWLRRWLHVGQHRVFLPLSLGAVPDLQRHNGPADLVHALPIHGPDLQRGANRMRVQRGPGPRYLGRHGGVCDATTAAQPAAHAVRHAVGNAVEQPVPCRRRPRC
jgi:hypothetical protein